MYELIAYFTFLNRLLAWLPWLVLGNIAVAVEMSGAVATPGQRITYVISANPIPQGTLGIILTEVAVSGDAGARRSWSWSLILTTAPQEVALTIPNGVPSQCVCLPKMIGARNLIFSH